MSGAFNIDIEVGPDDNNNAGVKIYCASLTDNWKALRTFEELKKFYQDLSDDGSVKNGKINIGSCPKNNDVSGYEIFLSELGCTAAVLRIKLFQDFLKIPMSVREGLSYAKHKPFGKTIKETYLMRHPRYVRRGSLKKFIRLTDDERGASLITFIDNQNVNKPQAALKLSKQTEMKILKEIQYAFVLKSGKRQWVLQPNNANEFKSWVNELTNILKKLGGKVDITNLNLQNNNTNNNNNINIQQSNDVKQLQAENKKLKDDLEFWKNKYTELEAKTRENNNDNDEIKINIDLNDANDDVSQIRKQLVKEFTKEKDDLIRDYEIQKDDLRAEIEDLRKQLETKVAVDHGKNGLKGLFGQGFKEEELKSEIDAEKNKLDSLTDEEKATIKFIHNHLHRHMHKHIHHHRHLHIHDNTKKPPVSYTNTHTVSHTITHTNTQFEIKKAKFF